MISILKGFIIVSVFFFILSSVHAQKEEIQIDKIHKPFVLNANEVPVLGGLLNIYGLNFGTDPNVISVYIYDSLSSSGNNASRRTECADVKIVLPNSIISCLVYEVGTGRSKHIEVTVDGVSNTNTDDVNFAFSRSAPMLNSVTYDGSSVIRVYGHHFGVNPSIVRVTLGGYEHPIIAVNDSIITCNKNEGLQLPSRGNVSTTADVLVMVDNQQSEASIELAVEDGAGVGVVVTSDEVVEEVPEEDNSMFSTALKLDTPKIIALALVPGVAGVVILIAFLIIRRKRASSASAAAAPITIAHDTDKTDSHAAVITGGPMVRDNSMEEIDLTSDTDRAPVSARSSVVVVAKPNDSPLKKSSSGMQSPTIYELNRATSSSSESSFSSDYSSACNTPRLYTPESVRRAPTLDMSDFPTATHNSRRSKRDHASSSLGEPVSRLGKRTMDSPYFTKENPFDSPMRSPFDSPMQSPMQSPELVASDEDSGEQEARADRHAGSGHPLQSSQEINQLHRNPFDSPSVLHSAIQRAAVLRGQQQQQQKQQQQQPQQQPQQPKHRKHKSPAAVSLRKKKPAPGRRASLGGPQNYNMGRRSSLGTISLHASALHASMGDYAHSTDESESEGEYVARLRRQQAEEELKQQQQQQQKQQPPLTIRSSQNIHRIEEEASDE